MNYYNKVKEVIDEMTEQVRQLGPLRLAAIAEPIEIREEQIEMVSAE